VLDIISLDYHETFDGTAGFAAEKSLQDILKNKKGQYLAVYEGAVPMKDGGIYCCVAGKSAIQIRQGSCGRRDG